MKKRLFEIDLSQGWPDLEMELSQEFDQIVRNFMRKHKDINEMDLTSLMTTTLNGTVAFEVLRETHEKEKPGNHKAKCSYNTKQEKIKKVERKTKWKLKQI